MQFTSPRIDNQHTNSNRCFLSNLHLQAHVRYNLKFYLISPVHLHPADRFSFGSHSRWASLHL